MTLATACALTGITAMIGLVLRRPVFLAALVPMITLSLIPPEPSPPGTIWSGESAYNLIRVLRRGRILFLLLNRPLGAHTVRDESTAVTGMYFDRFALGPLFTKSKRALVLGMGGGASIFALRNTEPAIQIDAVEIDGRVIKVAEQFFGLSADDPRMRITIADARPWLTKTRSIYDIVQIDMYQGGPYVPFYLVTVEFFKTVKEHLSEDGVLMTNVLDLGKRREILNATIATLQRVFATTVCIPCKGGSFIVCSFPHRRDVESLRTQLRHALVPDKIALMVKQSAEDLCTPTLPQQTPVFTDDRCSIEEMTRRMLTEAQLR